FHAFLARAAENEAVREQTTVTCSTCGAEVTFEPNVSGDLCPFCGSSVVVGGGSTRTIKPRSLLPFYVTREQATTAFQGWLDGLWFAPGDLKRMARTDGRLAGVYVPYWTYDTNTTSFYRGERGEDYWETEHYTAFENGKHVSKTRQVRKTRWYPASGTVWNRFNDVLVLASRSLPPKYIERLEPWDLQHLAPYADEYLSGFRTETYQVGLEQGFEIAKDEMDGHIRSSICRDIGGDHQQIHSVRTRYDNITFKHILLPVWINAYRYRERVCRFLVNARTGEVQGERPWSAAKIVLTVLASLAAAAALALAIAAATTR
ncbi:MAG: hypothetical protein JXL80_02375, partial [Planctomycetes bacterium]|nr:hypothetical protein [Planctomycetota bacterium]